MRPRLGLLEIEVRGIVFKHNLLILISFLPMLISADLNNLSLIVEICALVLMISSCM